MFKKTFIFLFFIGLSCMISQEQAHAYVNEFDAPHWSVEGYRSDYFLLGLNASKLSISFKIKTVNNTGFYFAYSQLMMWDLWADSQTMRDLNYNPDFFYRFNLSDKDRLWLDAGIEHESNGLGGDDSRGWNRVYLLYSSSANIAGEHEFFWSTKLWFPFVYDSTSLDIAKYRGIYELNFTVRNILNNIFDRNDLTIRIYPGGPAFIDPLRGGQEITLRFNRIFMQSFLPLVVVQFFHGYGENLLDDKKEKLEFRLGVGF
jgi:phospholipase A1